MFFHGSAFICLNGMSTTQRHTMCPKIQNVSVMCDGFCGVRKGNKIDRYRSRFSTPVADRYGTNYPPEFLLRAMVAQHIKCKSGETLTDWSGLRLTAEFDLR